jgi:Holliday junction resolvase RusA-like endonuclease
MVSSWPITIKYAGKPLGKGRPRFGKGRVYTPKKTSDYETGLAWAAKTAMKGRLPLKGPVGVDIKLRFSSKKGFYHIGKPDADNCIKCLDALNGIVFEDDSQIAFGTFVKLCGDEEYISVDIWPLQEPAL